MDIKKSVSAILTNQAKISEINKIVKVHRNKMNKGKEETKSFMEENKHEILDCGSHEILLTERTTKATVNKDFVSAVASKFFEQKKVPDGPDMAYEFAEFFELQRVEMGTKKLVLQVKKAKKTKKKRKKDEIDDTIDDAPASAPPLVKQQAVLPGHDVEML